jgi:hypothetical protein
VSDTLLEAVTGSRSCCIALYQLETFIILWQSLRKENTVTLTQMPEHTMEANVKRGIEMQIKFTY